MTRVVSIAKPDPDIHDLVSATLHRWHVQPPPDGALAEYERIVSEAAKPLGQDWSAAALATAVAGLIGEAIELQRLSQGADCSTTEMLLGDLYLAAAAALLPNLKRPAVEAQFATALMQAALGLEYRSLLRNAVAATVARTPRDEVPPSTVFGGADAYDMKPRSVEMTISTASRLQLIDVTDEVARLVNLFGLYEGRVHLFPLHTTMAVAVNENEALFHRDLEDLFERLAPSAAPYRHDNIGERKDARPSERLNGAAHVRQMLLAPSIVVPVLGGHLRLGTWQRAFVIELDGPQCRRVLLQLDGHFEPTGVDDLENIDRELLRVWVHDPIEVRMPFGSLVTAGGKRIRARLALLSSRLGPRHDESRALTLAAAVELVHNASLVHDDLVDNSTTRRGKPTVHTVYGTATALRTGVYYCGRAYRLLVDLDSPQATASVMQALGRLGQGEIDEFQMRGDGAVTAAQYLQVVSNKTAALTEAACAAGAALSAADPATVAAIKNYGQALGIALQIVDDVLDFSAKSGKTVGLDVTHSVNSLPVILALNSPKTADVITQLLAESPVPTDRITALLDSAGVLDAAMRLAKRYRDRALRSLSKLPASPALNDLAQIANFTVERSY